MARTETFSLEVHGGDSGGEVRSALPNSGSFTDERGGSPGSGDGANSSRDSERIEGQLQSLGIMPFVKDPTTKNDKRSNCRCLIYCMSNLEV